ncbi:outer dynein arm-docking complex subunit 4 [Amyelois transitella]|uniref:outer dynein arm-docking complex subunit 4 n=1 Tax=Amyelois transitella TaxID=680683 RepID=UPI00067E056E|nr:outer dynein arm-docking complex subunit 4 [Amyelois transitella]
MGRNKEPEGPISNPVEAKKHRDESVGHFQNGNYDRALNALHKLSIVRTMDNATAQARSILGPTKDAEFLQSFVRVGDGDEEDETPVQKESISKRAPTSADKNGNGDDEEIKHSGMERKTSIKPKKKKEHKPKRERRRREEEVYTDKDRAAAVVMGSKDIKLSLNMKDKAERSSALSLPEEADAGTLLAMSRAEMMRERYRTAVSFVDKAIELAPEEKAAYVARSKCYLLLGEPRLALADAETALKLDPKHAKALLQKAEALYYCGEFELSLVHFHRGLKARPDLSHFRLGVQKAQEAIENTIGSVKPETKKVSKKPPTKRSTSKPSRPPLGPLMSDKIYLENLLKNPDLAIADKKNDIVTKQAEEAIRFLENREEFWRQQQTTKTQF